MSLFDLGVVFAMAAVTYLPKVIPFVAIDAAALPPTARSVARNLAPAVMAGIAGPAAVLQSHPGISFDPTLLAYVAGAAVALIWRNVLLALFIGMGFVFVAQFSSGSFSH